MAHAQRVERLKESLHFIGVSAAAAPSAKRRRDDDDDDDDDDDAPPQQGAGKRRHVVFVDSASEVRAFDPAAHFDTPKELLGRAFNRPRTAQLEDPTALVLPRGQARKVTALTLKAEK